MHEFLTPNPTISQVEFDFRVTTVAPEVKVAVTLTL